MKRYLALTLGVSLMTPAGGYGQFSQEIAVLQLKVIEGEGMAHRSGSRSASSIVVLVSDETGRPVQGATVSFRLPPEGASGRFESGLPTEVQVTGADGKAAAWGIRWGKTPGPVKVRITAVKGEVRAGIFSLQYVADPQDGSPGKADANRSRTSKTRGRWVAIAVVAAGAAAGGLALGLTGKSAQTGAGNADASTSLSVGAPSIQVGKP
ncbi:MAG: hypothetical protein KIT09_30620 [Bryobacteraceae bacterium]|nr:hypothetical protein [Bryobacteraceae bacterium]